MTSEEHDCSMEKIRRDIKTNECEIPSLLKAIRNQLLELIGRSLVSLWRKLKGDKITAHEYQRRLRRIEWSIQNFGGEL